MPDQNTTSNRTGAATAISVILAIVAITGGMAAIVRPLQQQIQDLHIQLREHRAENNHPWGVVAEVAELRQKFAEVETQFDNLDERTGTIQQTAEKALEKIFAHELTAENRICTLEQKLKGVEGKP